MYISHDLEFVQGIVALHYVYELRTLKKKRRRKKEKNSN